jgi:hypothetical protein
MFDYFAQVSTAASTATILDSGWGSNPLRITLNPSHKRPRLPTVLQILADRRIARMAASEMNFERLSISEPSEKYTVWNCLSPKALEELSETEVSVRSTEEEQEELSDDGAQRLSYKEHRKRNWANLQRHLHPAENGGRPEDQWEYKELSVRDVRSVRKNRALRGRRFVIKRPTASNIPSLVLNPLTYRELGPIHSLDEFAIAMRVENWESKVRTAQQVAPLRWELVFEESTEFAAMARTRSESCVSAKFSVLVDILGKSLGIKSAVLEERRFGIGGVLADFRYAVRGITDLNFEVEEAGNPRCRTHERGHASELDKSAQIGNSSLAMSVEFKTSATFPAGNTWYHGSRGVQALGALWSGWEKNPFAPALLLTQEQFKVLLVRNTVNLGCSCKNESLQVFEFPSCRTGGMAATGTMQFLYALSIILLSPRRNDMPRTSRLLAEPEVDRWIDPTGLLPSPNRQGKGIRRSPRIAEQTLKKEKNQTDRQDAGSGRMLQEKNSYTSAIICAKSASVRELSGGIWLVDENTLDALEESELTRP